MAAFQFTVQQVSFASEDFLADTSSLDSLSSVIDPNVDFTSEVKNAVDEKNAESIINSTEEWYSLKSPSIQENSKIMEEGKNVDLSPVCTPECPSETNFPALKSGYPTIPLAVAHYINQNNPEICLGAEKCLNSENFRQTSGSENAHFHQESVSHSSPLHSMSVTTEALALQHSVIGNMGVKPVSADIVAQVVAHTKLRLEQSHLKNVTSLLSPENIPPPPFPNNIDKSSDSKTDVTKELVPYPPESISSTVEKRSWFSNTSLNMSNESTLKAATKSASKENHLSSRSSSQSSINSVGPRKNFGSIELDMPKVHSSKIKQLQKCSSNIHFDSPYEMNPDSSVEYETESSISEKFELESMCSEAFETESNFSEISGLDDELFQIRKLQDQNINKGMNTQNQKMVHNGTQVSSNDSPFKSSSKIHNRSVTDDKATETDENFNFQILREKANLEGRLEVVTKDQSDLVKERDDFRSLVTSLETQLKSLQNQLDNAIDEKKNATRRLEAQNKEQKNWDCVIKEYQSIIEAKNNEIKALKNDLSESEQANTRAKINYEELKVDLESREGAISGLKKKIAELHVEVQVLLQGKIQLENEVKNIRLEMETLQKSKEWFQEQLHSTQENRNKLHQELISLQSSLVNASNSLERTIIEKDVLKKELIHTQQRAVAEKEVLMKHLETIEADMKERESLFDEIQKDKGTVESALVERIRKIEDEKAQFTNMTFTLSDQEHQLKILKSECDEKTRFVESLEKEKAEMSKQIAILQKSLYDKDIFIQQQTQEIKDLNVKMNHIEMALRHSEELISKLKHERTVTDVALAAANEEKRQVNESLRNVSESLNKFKNNFKLMKAELVTRTSQAEQLLKEKKILEDSLRKNEESILLLRKEFEQKELSENQNRDVLFHDLKQKKNDVENVLNVYSKDLLNYQQIVENLSKQKVELNAEILNLKSCLESEKMEKTSLNEENISLKNKVSKLEKQEYELKNESKALNIDTQNLENAYNKTHLMLRGKKILYKKLKEKIKECEQLRNELEANSKINKIEENSVCSVLNSLQLNEDIIKDKKRIEELECLLEQKQKMINEQIALLENNKQTIIELEKEKGKALGFSDKYNSLKQHMTELEQKFSQKDSEAVRLNIYVEELKNQLCELHSSSKNQMSSLNADLNKEKTLVKSLRQQVFQEKRHNSHLQRDISSMKSALEQANQIADSKKQDIAALQAELSLKVQAELKHRAEIEHFQTEIRLQHSIVEKLNKELEEVKARDPALAEQIKAISWSLKEKTNELLALKEKQHLTEERYKLEVESLKKTIQDTESELASIKLELASTRKEKFYYQSRMTELRKALKSKLGELESKGILRIENKTSGNGPVIHLNIPDPEVSFDESYVNSLLQKSMHLSENRPLSNLQECLNSLKQEMTILQKKIIDNAELA